MHKASYAKEDIQLAYHFYENLQFSRLKIGVIFVAASNRCWLGANYEFCYAVTAATGTSHHQHTW